MEGQTVGEEKSFSEHPSQKPASSLVFIFRLTAVFLAVDKGAVKAGCCVVVHSGHGYHFISVYIFGLFKHFI